MDGSPALLFSGKRNADWIGFNLKSSRVFGAKYAPEKVKAKSRFG